MKTNFKKAATYCGLLSGLVIAGWYVSFYREMPDTLSTIEAKEEKKESAPFHDQLMPNDHAKKDVRISSQKANEPQEARTEEKLNRLQSEVESLRHKLYTLENRAALSPDGTPVTDSKPLSEEEQEQQLKAQLEKQLALYDSVAKLEGVDQTWAGGAEGKIYESWLDLDNDHLGLLEVKCHSSLCEARFSFDTAEGDSFMQTLNGFSPWPGETFITADTKSGEGIMYLAREGNNLPDTR